MSVTMISQVRRIPDGRPAVSDVATILKDLSGPLENRVPFGVGFALRAEPDLWVEVWECDAARLLWDICTYVLDALPEVGVATIDARLFEVGKFAARRLGLRRSGAYVKIEISHTADNLDLNDFALQIKMMRGRLDLESTPRVGGTVRILLPAQE